MLDYRIRSFLAVIEAGTLQKASDRLCLTQPAVSQHLKALEVGSLSEIKSLVESNNCYSWYLKKYSCRSLVYRGW